VITEACNILDSLFREISPSTVTITGKPKDRERLDITDYADLYAGRYTLPATKSVIFVSPPQYLVPFKAWESITAGGAYAPLSWWTTHNKLKHDRIGHILDKSTLRNTVDAICGLHQVIAKLPELARATLRHSWLQTSDLDPEFVIKVREGARQAVGVTFIVQSKLFALPVGQEPFPDDIQALQPHAYGKSRLSTFFGKWR
jgi:hypothetical protein